MQDLYEWKAVDQHGKVVTYQTRGPACVTEAEMRDHLQAGFPNLTVTTIDRVDERKIKPATGIVQRHTFSYGIIDGVEKELGFNASVEYRDSLLTYVKKLRTGDPRDARDFGVHVQRQFETAVMAARARRLTNQRSALGVAKSLLNPHAR